MEARRPPTRRPRRSGETLEGAAFTREREGFQRPTAQGRRRAFLANNSHLPELTAAGAGPSQFANASHLRRRPTLPHLLFTVTGLAGAGAGVALLREAWRRRPGPRAALILGGWALLGSAAIALALGYSGDVGVAVWGLAVSFAGLAAIAGSADRTARRKVRAAPKRLPPVGEDPATGAAAGAWRTVAVIILAGPLSMASALLAGLAVTASGPGSEADRMMAGALVTPLVWGAAMVWVCADRRLGRSLGLLATMALLSGLILALPRGGAA